MSEADKGPKMVRNREEGGMGYWKSVRYTDGGGNVRFRDEWVQVTPRTKGSHAGESTTAKKEEFVPPTFISRVSEELDKKHDRDPEDDE